MKYALVALALAASARAQSRDDIPECAIPCIDDAITSETSCDTTDFACACANIEKIQGAATGCVLSDCGADTALNEVLPAIEALCSAIGDGGSSTAEATSEPTSAAPTTSAAEETSAEETSAAETSAEETSAEETSAAETTEEPTTTPSVTPTVTQPPPTLTPIPTGTPTEEPTTIPTTGAAVALGPMGAAAIAALGLFAL